MLTLTVQTAEQQRTKDPKRSTLLLATKERLGYCRPCFVFQTDNKTSFMLSQQRATRPLGLSAASMQCTIHVRPSNALATTKLLWQTSTTSKLRKQCPSVQLAPTKSHIIAHPKGSNIFFPTSKVPPGLKFEAPLSSSFGLRCPQQTAPLLCNEICKHKALYSTNYLLPDTTGAAKEQQMETTREEQGIQLIGLPPTPNDHRPPKNANGSA